MIDSRQSAKILALALLLPLAATGCRKEEQAVQGTVKGIEQTAASAQQKAQATATELDQQRAELARIPLPTKSMYADVREPSQWSNPLLSVGPDYAILRIVNADANTSTLGQGTLLRPEAARRQQLQVRIADLAEAITAIPSSAWSYGRVIAVEESPDAPAKDRPAVRRNVEAVMRKLNDLGVVVEEWPGR